jgi:hypothetical protein
MTIEFGFKKYINIYSDISMFHTFFELGMCFKLLKVNEFTNITKHIHCVLVAWFMKTSKMSVTLFAFIYSLFSWPEQYARWHTYMYFELHKSQALNIKL